MAIYELVLTTTFVGQKCNNRFNYSSTGTPASVSGSFALASAFGAIYDEAAIPPGYPSGTPIDLIHDMLSDGVTFNEVLVINVYDDVDFYQTPFVPALFGQRGGESLSPTAAYGFFSSRVRRDIGRGYKRFPGVPESASQNGGVLTGQAIADSTAVSAVLTQNLVYDDEGQNITFSPVVVGKQRYNPQTQLPDPDGSAYRYYPTFAEQALKLAQSIVWDNYANTRTQRSRQYGTGQ